MKKGIFLVVALLMVVIAGVGAQKKTIGFCMGDVSDPFVASIQKGLEARAKELGFNVISQSMQDGQWDTQKAVIDMLMTKNIDLLAIMPAGSDTMLEPMRDVKNAGIPIICIDVNVSDESTYDSFITSDNKAGGAAAADAMAQLMNKKGKALILGPRAGVYTNDLRNSGFADQMAKKYPGIKVLPVQYYNNDPSTAASIVNNTLLTNPDLGGVFGGNLYGAQGAANAVESSGAKLAVVCFDAGPAQIEALQGGTIQALVVQKPKLMGIRAAEIAQKILKGEKVEKNIFLAPIIAFKKDITNKTVSQWFYGN